MVNLLKKRFAMLVLASASLLANPAAAVIIDFDAFTPGPFVGSIEDGFQIQAPANGAVFAQSAFCGVNCLGPAEIASPGSPAFSFSKVDGGDFTFESFDVASFQGGPGYMVFGLRNGIPLVGDFFPAPGPAPLTTYPASNLAGVRINQLVITLFPQGQLQILDNVRLGVIPEPATVTLGAAALFGFACARKRKAT